MPLREEALRRYFAKLIKAEKKPFAVWQNDKTGKSNRLKSSDMKIWNEMNGEKESKKSGKKRSGRSKRRSIKKSRKSKKRSVRKSKKKSMRKSKKKSKSRSPRSKRCHKLLQEKINMKEYEKGKYKSRGQALAVSYSQVKKRHPSCKRSLSRKIKEVSK